MTFCPQLPHFLTDLRKIWYEDLHVMPLTNISLREIGGMDLLFRRRKSNYVQVLVCRETFGGKEQLGRVGVIRRGTPCTERPLATSPCSLQFSARLLRGAHLCCSVFPCQSPFHHCTVSRPGLSVFELGSLSNLTCNTESQVRSQAKFNGVQSDSGTGLPPGTSDRLSPANCQNR
jgi:hypothetical protein